MFSLLDTAKISGTSQPELEDAIIDLVHHTGFTDTISPLDLKLYTVNKIHDQEIKLVEIPGLSAYDTAGGGSSYQSTNRVVSFRGFRNMDPDLFRETIAHGVLAGCAPWYSPVPVSSHAVDDLLAVSNLSGKGLASHAYEVLALISRCLINRSSTPVITNVRLNQLGEIESFDFRDDYAIKNQLDRHGYFRKTRLRFMYRWDDRGNVKIFSAVSPQYGEIPQTRVLDIIDRLFIFGKSEVRDWSIDHYRTQVNVSFPEIAEDYSETYGLAHTVMPGIRIVTSDSKDAAFCVEGTISIDGNDSLPMDADRARIAKRHYGSADIDSVLQRVNMDFFPLYRQYPEKLCEMLSMPDEIPVRKCLQAAFSAMQLRTYSFCISEKTEMDIIENLVSQAHTDTLPVYDAVSLALDAYKNENLQLSEHQREFLRMHALRAVLITEEYRQIIEEEKSCQYYTAMETSALLQAVS